MTYFPPNKLLAASYFSAYLGTWQQSLTVTNTESTAALFIGSSTTQGGNATTLDKRYVDVLGSELHGMFNDASVPGGRFIRAADDSSNWVKTGTVVLNGSGIGLDSHSLSTGATLERSFTDCTGVEFGFAQGPAQALFKYQIDGGTEVDVTPDTSGVLRYDGIVRVTGFSLGTHTLKVTATNACIVNGVYVYNGDNASGVRLYNSGKGSTSTTSFVAAAADTMWEQAAAIGDISLVLIMLGSNDYNNNLNPVTFKSNLATMIQKARTYLGAPSIALVNSYKRFDTSSPTYAYSLYGGKMRELADENADVAYIDVAGLFPLANNSVDDPFGFMDSDNIHMTDGGHNYMGQLLATRLTPNL